MLARQNPRKRTYALAAIALLIPCVWQPRIHAGDLSSHIYNAWLATLIEKGQAPGLYIQTMYTNVVFDIYLESLFKWFGSDAAQRIAVGTVVLVFTAGLFAYLRAVGGKRPWYLFPAAAMLAYGWVFHMGFFNFLLSLGFALMALGVFFGRGRARVWIAGVLLALSFGSHFMPALWAMGVALYRVVHQRLKPRWTPALFGASLLIVGAMRLGLNARYQIAPPDWGTSLAGVDQFWLFGAWTFVFVPWMLLVWGLLFMRVVEDRGPMRMLLGFPAQALLLNIAGVLLLPGEIRPGDYQIGFTFITQRLSLFVAISICALLVRARPRRWEIAAMAAACCAFFGTIFVKGRELDRLEDRVDRIVATLPQGSPVIAPLGADSRTSQWGHIIDRACIGRCFSYANYEPGTNLFRIRVNGPTVAAAPDFQTSFQLQAGIYHPPPGSPAYYEIDEDCGRGVELCSKYVDPGAVKAAVR
jgi:hypothetical protein